MCIASLQFAYVTRDKLSSVSFANINRYLFYDVDKFTMTQLTGGGGGGGEERISSGLQVNFL